MLQKLFVIIKRYLKSPRRLIRTLGDRGFFNWLPDAPYLKLVFWGETTKRLNLKTPITFNEKLQWLKLYDRKQEYTRYVDKFEVRSYISETIGEDHLIPLLGVYTSVDEIQWDKLPNSFVLKCTHGSGCNIICTDKNELDIKKAKSQLNKWLKKNWFWFGREWPYKDVKPRIICEKFISDTDLPPMDYKVLCFNGKAKLIEVHLDRFGLHKQDFYTVEWEKTGITQGFSASGLLIDKPIVLENMLSLSEILAKNTFHVRIDWYIVKNRLFFGEITFYDGSGFVLFDDERDDILLGGWIKL